MYIAVAGLIGAGKSTLVDKLAQNGCTVFEEPVNNNPFLSLYYDDPCRWSYTLQTYYLWERYKQSQEAYYRSLRGETTVVDSSIYSDMAFAIVQKRSKFFTAEEFETYLNMHKIIASQLAYPDMFIWLHLSTELALDRIKQRSRECELDIPIGYLHELSAAYDEVLDRLNKHTHVVIIDASKSVENVYSQVSTAISNHRLGINNLNYQ